MSSRYQGEIQIGQQEDGLWRVEVPSLTGGWVDAPTLEQAFTEIQEGIAMALDEYEERGREIPSSVTRLEREPT
jgi:predicted RNase H-like HicB family nuclease